MEILLYSTAQGFDPNSEEEAVDFGFFRVSFGPSTRESHETGRTTTFFPRELPTQYVELPENAELEAGDKPLHVLVSRAGKTERLDAEMVHALALENQHGFRLIP